MCRISERTPPRSYNHFISQQDITVMARPLENDKICLHLDNVILIKLWIDKLKADDINVFYKDRLDLSPLDQPYKRMSWFCAFEPPFN
jgi:hypothetical protein